MFGQRKHHIKVSFDRYNHFTLCNMVGSCVGVRMQVCLNPAAHPSFPYTMLPPTSQKGHSILLYSVVICPSAYADFPMGRAHVRLMCTLPLTKCTHREGPSK